MSLQPPRLDDRSTEDLIEDARAALVAHGAQWRADVLADPGLMLLEAFARITATELERLNALPTAAHASFMNMLGAVPEAATAAHVMLSFRRSTAGAPLTVPAGTRVAAPASPEAIFVTLDDLTLSAEDLSGSTLAAHLGTARALPLGRASGQPAQRFTLPNSPLPGAPEAAARVVIWIEGQSDAPGLLRRRIAGRDYLGYVPAPRSEVARGLRPCVQLDRHAATVTLPASGAFVPHKGAQICADFAWIPGPTPPLEAGQLTDLLSPVSDGADLTVTNAEPIRQGRAAETLQSRLARDPLAHLAAGQAVRARDYEAIAMAAATPLARAHAEASRSRWHHAAPGSLTLLLEMESDVTALGAVTQEARARAVRDDGALVRATVLRALEAAMPLGVALNVDWLRARAVGVQARLHVLPGTDLVGARERALRRINALLSPQPTAAVPAAGWPLGQTLRIEQVIAALGNAPEVRAADRVRLVPEDPMPGPVTHTAQDATQPGLRYVLAAGCLYRSADDASGWCRIGQGLGSALDDVTGLACHPEISGLVAVVDRAGRISASRDAGHSFRPLAQAQPDAAPQMLWVGRDAPRLILGGEAPLSDCPGPAPDDPETPAPVQGFDVDGTALPGIYALDRVVMDSTTTLVAVAQRALGGVRLSFDGGKTFGTYPVTLTGRDVRHLRFLRRADGAIWLVAGCAKTAHARQGPLDAPVLIAQIATTRGLLPVIRWQAASEGWHGGGVRLMAAAEDRLLASDGTGQIHRGTLRDDGTLFWSPEAIAGGTSGASSAHPTALQVSPHDTLIALGDRLRLAREGGAYEDVSDHGPGRSVTLPGDWTLCAGAHQIEVLEDDY